MNTVSQRIGKEDTKCAGKDCPNAGSIPLKINYINRIGYFCESCSSFLVREDLALRLENNSPEKDCKSGILGCTESDSSRVVK